MPGSAQVAKVGATSGKKVGQKAAEIISKWLGPMKLWKNNMIKIRWSFFDKPLGGFQPFFPNLGGDSYDFP